MSEKRLELVNGISLAFKESCQISRDGIKTEGVAWQLPTTEDNKIIQHHYNSHEDLLAVCEAGLKDLMRFMLRLDTSEADGTIRKMQAAIAKAKETPNGG